MLRVGYYEPMRSLVVAGVANVEDSRNARPFALELHKLLDEDVGGEVGADEFVAKFLLSQGNYLRTVHSLAWRLADSWNLRRRGLKRFVHGVARKVRGRLHEAVFSRGD